MTGDILQFLIEISFTILGAAFLARCWLHAIRFHPFNPFAQLIIRATEWLTKPLGNVLPKGRSIDYASLLGAYLMAVAYLLFMWMVATRTLPSMELFGASLMAALVTMGRWALNLVIWLTLIQAILSWVNPMAPIMPVLRTLTAPLLEPIRRIMPNFGGFDLSPLVLIILAQVAMMVLSRISFTLFGV
jgi:YggT family protein